MTNPTTDFTTLLGHLMAALRAKSRPAGGVNAGTEFSAGVAGDLAGTAETPPALAGATGRVRTAEPLFASAGALDVAPAGLSPAGAADASSRTTAAEQATQPGAAAVTEAPPSFTPPSVSDAVRSGVPTPFNAANMADPAAALASSSGKDVLAQLGDIRVSPEVIKLARSLGNLIGGAYPQLPPPGMMRPPAGRARPVQPPKAPPKAAPTRRRLALSAGGADNAQRLRLLLRFLQP